MAHQYTETKQAYERSGSTPPPPHQPHHTGSKIYTSPHNVTATLHIDTTNTTTHLQLSTRRITNANSPSNVIMSNKGTSAVRKVQQ